MQIPDTVQTLVASGPLVHLTTLNADGSPQVSVVWIGLEGDNIVVASMGNYQKIRNVQRDGRVAMSMLAEGLDGLGLQQYLVVTGHARVTEGGAADLLQRLAVVYLGPDIPFPPEPDRHRPGYVMRVTPERFGGNGPWVPQ